MMYCKQNTTVSQVSQKSIKFNEIETRLVCPCCHMGFISLEDEMENKFTFPSSGFKFIAPVDYPTCNNCDSRFEIAIDKTLKIKIRKIEY